MTDQRAPRLQMRAGLLIAAAGSLVSILAVSTGASVATVVAALLLCPIGLATAALRRNLIGLQAALLGVAGAALLAAGLGLVPPRLVVPRLAALASSVAPGAFGDTPSPLLVVAAGLLLAVSASLAALAAASANRAGRRAVDAPSRALAAGAAAAALAAAAGVAGATVAALWRAPAWLLGFVSATLGFVWVIGPSLRLLLHPRPRELHSPAFIHALTHAANGVAVLGLEGAIVEVNKALCRMLGFSAEQLTETTLLAVTHRADVGALRDLFVDLGRRPRDVPAMEQRFVHASGREIWAIFSIGLLRTPSGSVSAYVAQVQDVTGRKQMELDLRRSQERYDLAAGAARVGVWDWDQESDAVYLDRHLRSMLGWPSGEVADATDNWERLIVADDLPPMREVVTAYLQRRKRSFDIDVRLAHSDGGTLWVHLSGVATWDDDNAPRRVVGTCADISERKRTEASLVHLERLRALGELAAGVSHNLNNILTGVLGPAQLLRDLAEADAGGGAGAEAAAGAQPQSPGAGATDTQVPAAVAARRETQDLLTSAMRAKDLVEQLDRAVRAQGDKVEPVAVHAVVGDAVAAARPRWKDAAEARGVKIDVHCQLGDTAPVRGVTAQLHSIIVNLLLNSADALPAGGRVTIASRQHDDTVEVVVADDGIGMSEEVRRRVFEPFFTTKADIGTGLGLATVYNTVLNWGGHIDVQSAPRRGTTVTVRIPVWEEPAATQITPLPSPRAGTRRRVLVVEDDELVAGVLTRTLERQHDVRAVHDGPAAVALVQRQRFDVAFVDLGMPGMPGDKVRARLGEIAPELATVLITGWNLTATDPRAAGFDVILPKPFANLTAVARAVEDAIGMRAARRGA